MPGTLDHNSNTNEQTWSFPFWGQRNLKAHFLKAHMRSGFAAEYDQLEVSYCSAERAAQRCQIGVSNVLLLAVVMCAFVKTTHCVLLIVSFVSPEKERRLVTLGDAADSLIRQPDQTTARMCTLELRDLHLTWYRLFGICKSVQTTKHCVRGEMAELVNGEVDHEHVSPHARQWRLWRARYFFWL